MPSVNEPTDESQLFSGKLVWAALRQLQALRESLTWTLDGKFLFRANEDEASHLREKEEFTDGWTLLTLDEHTVPVWLRQQGLGNHVDKERPSIATAMEGYRIHLLRPSAYKALRSEQRCAHQGSNDFGADRSSAGWFRSINFCITSVFVRLLGAWEQYEIDVLKALFYYRSTGLLGPEGEHILQQADDAIVREEPSYRDKKRVFPKHPVWTWVIRYAENNVERAKIFSDVFGIKARPKETGGQSEAAYEKRNAIAHGRLNVEMTLAEYVDADVLVFRSVTHLADQCREQQKLIV